MLPMTKWFDSDLFAWFFGLISSAIKIWYITLFKWAIYSPKQALLRIWLWWFFALVVAWAIPDEALSVKQVFALWWFVWFTSETIATIIENNFQKKVEEKIWKL